MAERQRGEKPRILNKRVGLADPTSLTLYPRNPRKGDVEEVTRSFRENGFWGRVTVDLRTGFVLAGNHRVIAARELGWKKIPVEYIETEDDDHALRINLADNRTSDLGGYDEGKLADLLGYLASTPAGLAGSGYDGDAMDELLRNLGRQSQATPNDRTGELAALRDEWGTALGQIWRIPSLLRPGSYHRLACGSSTDPDLVRRLMDGRKAALVYTDPPYGVGYDSDALGGIENDALDDEALYALIAGALTLGHEHTTDNAAFYIWHASSTRGVFDRALVDAGLKERQYIIWVKESLVLGRADYHWQHETCYYAAKASAPRPFFTSARNHTTVWEFVPAGEGEILAGDSGVVLTAGTREKVTVSKGAKRGATEAQVPAEGVTIAFGDSTVWKVRRDKAGTYLHPNQKPVALAERAITNSSKHGDVVLDLFAGAGAVFLAAEQRHRLAYGVDLDPRFVAASLDRMAKMGLTPEKIEG